MTRLGSPTVPDMYLFQHSSSKGKRKSFLVVFCVLDLVVREASLAKGMNTKLLCNNRTISDLID